MNTRITTPKTCAPALRTRHTPLALSIAVLGAAATLQTPMAQAAGDSPWLVRGGLSQIEPKSDNGQLSAGNIAVDSQFGPSLNVAYYFSPNWAVDVLGALPFKHDFSINGAEAGSTKHLPPTVTLQYHFLPQAKVQPFVGLGLNYTFFMEERLSSGNKLEMDDSFGLAAQLGVDVPLNPQWRVGLDARFIDIDSDATVDGQSIGTVNIDPIVYSLNLGYRF
ncbi:OmpW/AlkL family protein [Sinimarinibacterium thermocellulolyticum]|jgi:outer membrane protein|uniref:OmpW family outer membrane protein n=1 Tax=Sinimarinibacterium thermocellulolyticum TaxID=3170016 RepID=A0ABV2A942_9GAMM